MSNRDIANNWLQSAMEDKKAALVMFNSGHYHWCLFLWHLALEKKLKALLTIKDQEIPFTHNLLHLAKTAKMVLSDLEEKEFQEITTFNLEARYDDYKQSFFKKATQEYTQKWIIICDKWFTEKIRL